MVTPPTVDLPTWGWVFAFTLSTIAGAVPAWYAARAKAQGEKHHHDAEIEKADAEQREANARHELALVREFNAEIERVVERTTNALQSRLDAVLDENRQLRSQGELMRAKLDEIATELHEVRTRLAWFEGRYGEGSSHD